MLCPAIIEVILPREAESLLHSLERTAGGIDLHVNTDKTEYITEDKTE